MMAIRPGAIPLRPLVLGDIYDATIRILRRNFGATIGAAMLVSTLTMLAPLLIAGIATAFGASDLGKLLPADEMSAEAYSAFRPLTNQYAGIVLILVLGIIPQAIALIFVTAMSAPVTYAAATGKRLTFSEAWAKTKGHRWRVVGLATLQLLVSLLILAVFALVFLLTLIADLSLGTTLMVNLLLLSILGALGAFFMVRLFLFATTALLLEPIGIITSLGRTWQLSSKQFWRLFGIMLLSILATTVLTSAITFPLGILGFFGTMFPVGWQLFVSALVQAFSSIIVTSIQAPFMAVLYSVLYLDQRIRKEGFDLELMTQAHHGSA
jgi:hypothetical protein